MVVVYFGRIRLPYCNSFQVFQQPSLLNSFSFKRFFYSVHFRLNYSAKLIFLSRFTIYKSFVFLFSVQRGQKNRLFWFCEAVACVSGKTKCAYLCVGCSFLMGHNVWLITLVLLSFFIVFI